MTISAISHYRGGDIDTVTPLAKRQRDVLAKHGVLYRLSRFTTGANTGDWLVVVTYPDRAAYDAAQDSFAKDHDYQKSVSDIMALVTQVSRELVEDLELT